MRKRIIAERIGLTPSTFSSYWTARAAMPIDVLERIVAEFKLDRTALYVKAFGITNALSTGLLKPDDLIEDALKTEPSEARYHQLHYLSTFFREPFKSKAKTLADMNRPAAQTSGVAAENFPSYAGAEGVATVDGDLLPLCVDIACSASDIDKNRIGSLPAFASSGLRRYYLKVDQSSMAPEIIPGADIALIEQLDKPLTLKLGKKIAAKGGDKDGGQTMALNGKIVSASIRTGKGKTAQSKNVIARLIVRASDETGECATLGLRAGNADWRQDADWQDGLRFVRVEEEIVVHGVVTGLVRDIR
ncbi:MAG: hypothetical protein ABIH86_03985 [Planctomycetota bacterium]